MVDGNVFPQKRHLVPVYWGRKLEGQAKQEGYEQCHQNHDSNLDIAHFSFLILFHFYILRSCYPISILGNYPDPGKIWQHRIWAKRQSNNGLGKSWRRRVLIRRATKDTKRGFICWGFLAMFPIQSSCTNGKPVKSLI